MQALQPMCLVVLMWAGLSLAMAGIGLAVRRLAGLGPIRLEDAGKSLWIGWGFTIGFLQLWHLFLPVDLRALSVVVILGIAGLACVAKGILLAFRGNMRRNLVFSILALATTLWLASHTVVQDDYYDSGLYHLSAVRWIRSFSIVPGLGNLHGRLAFNNSSFLYVALLDVAWFPGRVHHIASGLLLLFALLRTLISAYRLCVERDLPRADQVFDVLCLVPVIDIVLGGALFNRGISPDIPAFLVGLVLCSEVLRLIGISETGQPSTQRREAWYSAGCILLLGAVGVTVKVAFVAVAGAASVFSMLLLRRFGRVERSESRMACLMAGACLLLSVAWLVRGSILSGWILYPMPMGALPVDWQIPAEQVRWMNRFIHDYAHGPGSFVVDADRLGAGRWFWLWVNLAARHRVFDVVVPLAFLAAGVGIMLFRRLRHSDKAPVRDSTWYIMVPATGLVFWFLSAPDVRFSCGAFWALGLGAFALSIRGLDRNRVGLMLIVVTVLLLVQNVCLMDLFYEWNRDIGPVRTVSMKTMTTDSGLKIHVPVEGDQCWDGPLPCTPYFDANLRLRDGNDMSKGFTLQPTGP